MSYYINNLNCDGDKCCSTVGEVRVYPLSDGANLILCRTCWRHENLYRVSRGRRSGNPRAWPVVDWDEAARRDVCQPEEPPR